MSIIRNVRILGTPVPKPTIRWINENCSGNFWLPFMARQINSEAPRPRTTCSTLRNSEFRNNLTVGLRVQELNEYSTEASGSHYWFRSWVTCVGQKEMEPFFSDQKEKKRKRFRFLMRNAILEASGRFSGALRFWCAGPIASSALNHRVLLFLLLFLCWFLWKIPNPIETTKKYHGIPRVRPWRRTVWRTLG